MLRTGPPTEFATADEEAALVAAARRDPQAFAPLYHRYFDPVYRYCYRRLGGPEAAADATSQVFAKALAALPRYRDGSFRSWLFAIAHNTVVDCARSVRADRPLEVAATVVDAVPTPEEVSLAAGAMAMLGFNDQDARVLLAVPFGITRVAIGWVLWPAGSRRVGASHLASSSPRPA